MPAETEGSREWRRWFDGHVNRWVEDFNKTDPGIRQAATDLLNGAVDFHAHCDPSVIMRSADAFEVAVEASNAGMRALVIKDHHTSTAPQAWLAQRHSGVTPPFEILGSIHLNNFAGGYNVYAVDSAINFGARLVACPTLSTPTDIAKRAASGYSTQPPDPTLIKAEQIPEANRPILTLDDNGEVLPEVIEVIDRVLEAGNVALGMGHLGKEEVWKVAETASKRGLERILMTHVQSYTFAEPPEIRELCERTGAFAEITTVNLSKLKDEEIADLVRTIGPEHIAFGTDAGVAILPKPLDFYLQGIASFLRAGLSEDDVVQMTKTNQWHLLAIS